MTIKRDQSTPRQYAEGTSPLTQIREYDAMQNERETAATQIVERRARIMGAGKYAIAWGCLGARNAVKAGESAHRAIEVGVTRVTDVMEAQE